VCSRRPEASRALFTRHDRGHHAARTREDGHMAIAGTEGLSNRQIQEELAQGARFVVFEYCISVIILTFKRSSGVHYLRPGESALVKGLPYTLISLLLGWWGFPFGIIFTPMALYKNLSGGRDVTALVLRG
jgi:hypothetical protein